MFTDYTGMTHSSLLADWGNKIPTTSCNSFVGLCATAMGYPGPLVLSKFEIAAELAGRGLGHVWVQPSSGSQPECGDIFRLLADKPDINGKRLNHMGVVLNVVGATWLTVEGGQGGPKMGFDQIARKQYDGQPYGLQGWVSMRALFNSAVPLPYWLGGWWKVEQEPYETWYYHFGANGKVACTDRPPSSPLMAPPVGILNGTFRIAKATDVEIMWNSQDLSEEITIVADADRTRRKDTLVGTINKRPVLKGIRL